MDDMKRVVSSFLNLLCEVCGAERARMRISISDENRPIIILDERLPVGGAVACRDDPTIQISLFGPYGNGVEGLPAHSRISHSMCGETAMSNGQLAEALGSKEWKFSRSIDGFHIELNLYLHEGAAGFINDRLSRAATFLDLFESLLDGRRIPDHRSRPGCDAGSTFNPPLLGETAAMAELRRSIAALSPSDISILIEGESGTGKEVVAQNVHRLSRRHAKPLVISSSSEMPHSLLQSELFGHTEGAFTGASRDRAGLIESANGGTFFLDEIGEMPLALQATLLRVLQEKEVRRLGESKRRKVDVRFVFASNRDLFELVKKGKFRKDLYFRISGVRLHIPPLRMRKEDILPLARHFLSCAAGQAGCRAPSLSPGAIRRLIRYQWPGNVRELKAEMERFIALHGGERVIPPELLSPHVDEASEADSGIEARNWGTIPEAVRRLERAMIREALGRFAGNRTKAAEALGITRQGLLKKLKRYKALDGDCSGVPSKS